MAAQEKQETKVPSTEQVVELTISRLRELQKSELGGSAPAWLLYPNVWGDALSQLASDAADLIELYRSGRDISETSEQTISRLREFFDSLTPDQKRIYLSFWAKP